MSQLTTTAQIIQAFELFAGDETELSTQEELDLLQKIYNEVLNAHEWQFLKKPATGNISTSADYITKPSDFKKFANPPQFLVGSGYEKYTIVPYNDRRAFYNRKGYVYYDARLERVVFTMQPTDVDTYEFDYIYIPAALDIVSSNPVFPTQFYDLLYHGMLVDNDIIQMSEKARSYQDVNQARYMKILKDMKLWNDDLTAIDHY